MMQALSEWQHYGNTRDQELQAALATERELRPALAAAHLEVERLRRQVRFMVLKAVQHQNCG